MSLPFSGSHQLTFFVQSNDGAPPKFGFSAPIRRRQCLKRRDWRRCGLIDGGGGGCQKEIRARVLRDREEESGRLINSLVIVGMTVRKSNSNGAPP